jgi:hypothetical protein
MKGEAKESDAQPAALAMKAAEARGDAKQKDMEEETKRKDEAATKVREDRESDQQAAASEAKEREAKVSDLQAAVSDPQAKEAKERQDKESDPQAAVSDLQATEAKEREAGVEKLEKQREEKDAPALKHGEAEDAAVLNRAEEAVHNRAEEEVASHLLNSTKVLALLEAKKRKHRKRWRATCLVQK